MPELLTTIAELRHCAAEMKGAIVTSGSPRTHELRELFFELEAVIHAMERSAADTVEDRPAR